MLTDSNFIIVIIIIILVPVIIIAIVIAYCRIKTFSKKFQLLLS